MVDPDTLAVGSESLVAAHAYLTGTLDIGNNCTVNAFTVVRGSVSTGDGVRIGAHTSILGFNHSMDPSEPLFRQPLTSKGIVLGDDVWIGSNVVVLDGVTVGSHAVLAAGAVVTKDVPEWAVVGGNPARMIRDRRARPASRGAGDGIRGRLARFADAARDDAPAILARSWDRRREAAAAARGAATWTTPGARPPSGRTVTPSKSRISSCTASRANSAARNTPDASSHSRTL